MIGQDTASKNRYGRGETRTTYSFEDLTRRNIETIARLEEAAQNQRTAADRVADAIAAFCGNMKFVWVHAVWFGLWVLAGTLPGIKHYDPFPFQFLTLVVSLEAIFLTTFVMISQNRQARTADRRNHLDLQINLLAEQENSKMLTMLAAIMDRLGLDSADPEVLVLEEATEPDKLVHQIENIIEKSGAEAAPGAGEINA
jgi:uncharacterized membrane protein